MEQQAATEPKTKKKKMIDRLLLLAFFYFGLAGGLYLNQQHYLYAPDASRPDLAKSHAADMKVIEVKTSDGLTLQGWYKAPANAAKPVVVVFQGDGGNIGDRSFKAGTFIKAGYGVLLAEYRGYGGNPGVPGERGLYTDAHAYINWLGTKGIPVRRVVFYGESLGTGVAVQMALDYARAKALVLETPYTDLLSVDIPNPIWRAVRWVVRDRYDNAAKMDKVAMPVLVVFGDKDIVIPNAQGQRIFDLAREPKKLEVIPGGGHNDLYNFGAGAKIISFLGHLK
jgi:uncharacterized protein